MAEISRRTFLANGARLAALLGLGSGAVRAVAQGLQELSSGAAPVLWLQAQTCSGCSVTVLNSEAPGPAEILTQLISLRFHQTLSATSGEQAMEVINGTVARGGYLLVVEGSIPATMPEACMIGHETVEKLVLRAAAGAKAVIAQGTCAAYGGIPAAQNNPTGAMSVRALLKAKNIATPVISLPGCPPHPDWTVGTLVQVLKFGLPRLDAEGRPTMFYGRLVHDQCPRFADYERERFAKRFGEDGCLFELGCLGPNTHADCTLRHWNGGTSNCIKAGAPCSGCASREFALRRDFAFLRLDESVTTRGKGN